MRGYHAYFMNTTVYIGEILDCEIEPENDHDKQQLTLSQKKANPLLLTNNALFTISSVICAMRIMLATHADTCINALKNREGKHVRDHGRDPRDISRSFKILQKCQSKFDCLIYEMLFTKELKPTLNTQSDSIRAKLFL